MSVELGSSPQADQHRSAAEPPFAAWSANISSRPTTPPRPPLTQVHGGQPLLLAFRLSDRLCPISQASLASCSSCGVRQYEIRAPMVVLESPGQRCLNGRIHATVLRLSPLLSCLCLFQISLPSPPNRKTRLNQRDNQQSGSPAPAKVP